MEMIAPLAKVLAEANGIDWRKIQGTGDGGQVVEEDILNYLTRVMEGDEEPPATPVDPPPPDWDGDMNQLPDMAVLAAAGVDSDIANYVATARNESADLAGDVMDFELELDDEDADVAAAHEAPIDPIDDLPSVQPVVEPPAAPPAAASAGIGGSLLSSLYRKPDAQDAAPAPSQPAPQPEPVAASAPAPVVQPEPQVVAPAPEPEVVEVAPAAQAPVVQPEVAQPRAVEPAPVPVAPVVTPPAPAPVAAQPAPTSAPVQPAPTYTPAPVAAPISGSFVTLRRSFGAYALVQAGEQLGEHFGGASAPLAIFVARAAARSIGTLGFASVGVYGDDLAPLATPNLTGAFRDAASDLLRPQGGAASDLMVVDAGELGLDEITVASGVTLSFGEDVLTLSGAVSVKRGAAFLKEVAELLESPIRLML